jgi:hypothetical protein
MLHYNVQESSQSDNKPTYSKIQLRNCHFVHQLFLRLDIQESFAVKSSHHVLMVRRNISALWAL